MVWKEVKRVSSSPWPVLTSVSLVLSCVSLVSWVYRVQMGGELLVLGGISVGVCLSLWIRDLLREVGNGCSSYSLSYSFRDVMILFIISEIMFFFSFFWGFFHGSVMSGSLEDPNWPPKGLFSVEVVSMPLTNTLLLLTSSALLGITAWDFKAKFYDCSCLAYSGLSVFFGGLFLLMQYKEFVLGGFSVNDSSFGSIVYLIIGFHGAHVVFGMTFLAANWVLMWSGLFKEEGLSGFKASVWYWHFVDVVWISLYLLVYLWGNSGFFVVLQSFTL
nr:cytochrome c oxidase subunit III [Semimytilus algosus]